MLPRTSEVTTDPIARRAIRRHRRRQAEGLRIGLPSVADSPIKSPVPAIRPGAGAAALARRSGQSPRTTIPRGGLRRRAGTRPRARSARSRRSRRQAEGLRIGLPSVADSPVKSPVPAIRPGAGAAALARRSGQSPRTTIPRVRLRARAGTRPRARSARSRRSRRQAEGLRAAAT